MSHRIQLATIDQLPRFLRNIKGVTRKRIDNALRGPIAHVRRRGGGRVRRLIDIPSARRYFAARAEAIRSGRTTTDPWKDSNGVTWLPVGPLANDDHSRARIAKWWKYGCHWLGGAKLPGQMLWAAGKRGDFDSLVLNLFVRKKEWAEVERAIAADKATREAKKNREGASPASRKQGERGYLRPADLDAAHWASTPDAKRMLGLRQDKQLYTWNEGGYPTHTGLRLPLDCVHGGRGGVSFWRIPHLNAIKSYRDARTSDQPLALFEPFQDKDGEWRIRLRTVRHYMKAAGVKDKDLPSEGLIRLWCPEVYSKEAKPKRERKRGCGPLGGALLDIIPWPSLNANQPSEQAVLKSQIDAIIEAYKKSSEEYDKTDYFEDENGVRFAPSRIALRCVNSVILHEERHKSEKDRSIEVRREFLPWRPGRKWNTKHYVYRVEGDKSLLSHPNARKDHPLYPALPAPAIGNGHGHAPAASPVPAPETVAVKQTKKRGRPSVDAAEALKRITLVEEWRERSREGRCSRQDFADERCNGDVEYLETARDWYDKKSPEQLAVFRNNQPIPSGNISDKISSARNTGNPAPK